MRHEASGITDIVPERGAVGLGLLCFLEFDQTAADGCRGGLRAVAYAELAEQAVHVRLLAIGNLLTPVLVDEPERLQALARGFPDDPGHLVPRDGVVDHD